MMGVIHFWLFVFSIYGVEAYSNFLYTISEMKYFNTSEVECLTYEEPSIDPITIMKNDPRQLTLWSTTTTATVEITEHMTTVERDPLEVFENVMNNFLFGSTTERADATAERQPLHEPKSIPDHYPSGDILRGDLYQNRSGVHLPLPEFLHRGHLRLNDTMDYMQTAVNAFAIFQSGDLDDILRLPAEYVLHSFVFNCGITQNKVITTSQVDNALTTLRMLSVSGDDIAYHKARSISMMMIAREKLAATWAVVKGHKRAIDVSFRTLEMYRPLFKYLNGKEMSKLNLSDSRILRYIGTHAELDRHQVGVIASKYTKLNQYWSEPKYLNMMNNLLCGVPMTFMRKIPENTYLQLSHQVFYHIHACDPLQRRFYLAMMTRSQALGKSYSWNARDVSRLGLLLAEVDGPDLSAINPEAMTGITSHVMSTMDPQKLTYFTETQLNFMEQKPLNILTRKVRAYQDRIKIYNSKSKRLASAIITSPFLLLFFLCK